MDDVMEDMMHFHIPDSSNITSAPHPKFAEYYKPRISSFDQEERRAALLLAQKARREALLKAKRHLDEENGDEEDHDEEMLQVSDDIPELPQQALVEKSRKFRTWLSADDLKDKLMYSEWLVDVPGNLRSDWLFVMCPQGCRCLVVAADGKTEVFSTGGTSMRTFCSLLPGGNAGSKGSMTILDCIFDGQVFHILDALCWNRLSLLDYETAARVEIVKTQVAAEPGLGVSSPSNPHCFSLLTFYPVTELEERIEGPLPFKGKLDGVLFYHKKTVYTHGYTPLVGWLKAHMLPRLLNVKVPNNLLKGNELLLWQPNRLMPNNLPLVSKETHSPKQAEVMEIVELPVDVDVSDLPIVSSHPV